MGVIWNAAKRGEGYQLARFSDVTWVIVTFAVIGHFLFRFFSGRPLHGDQYRKTDASWSLPGRTLLHPKERAPMGWNNPHGFCWSRLPERRRAAIRVGLLVVAIGIVWGWWDGTPFDGSLVHDLFSGAGICYVWYFLYTLTAKSVERTKDRRHTRDRINPLKAALAPFLNTPAADIDITLTRKP
jgi:hypothetical protein